jgi:hypothetical protein
MRRSVSENLSEKKSRKPSSLMIFTSALLNGFGGVSSSLVSVLLSSPLSSSLPLFSARAEKTMSWLALVLLKASASSTVYFPKTILRCHHISEM